MAISPKRQRELAPRAWPARWRALERVGEGASAEVWRAEHEETGAVAAIKIAKPGHALAREAELSARLARRWGPKLLDAGVTPAPESAAFVATEWVEGRALEPAKVAKADRERVAAVVAHAVARALSELHEAGVRHGDVKPANVVLHPTRGQSSKPKRDVAAERGATLIDIGLATSIEEDALAGGTPRYLAPEARAHGNAGPLGDLWALGVMLAEILDPAIAEAKDARSAIAAWDADARARARGGIEIARLVDALVADAPGGRPSAAWVAMRAARIDRKSVV